MIFTTALSFLALFAGVGASAISSKLAAPYKYLILPIAVLIIILVAVSR